MQSMPLSEGELRGHSFHHGALASPPTPPARAVRAHGGGTARGDSLAAGCMHAWFRPRRAAVDRPLGAPLSPARPA